LKFKFQAEYKFHLIYWLFVFISEIQIYMIIISTLKIHFLHLIPYLINSKPLKTHRISRYLPFVAK